MTTRPVSPATIPPSRSRCCPIGSRRRPTGRRRMKRVGPAWRRRATTRRSASWTRPPRGASATMPRCGHRRARSSRPSSARRRAFSSLSRTISEARSSCPAVGRSPTSTSWVLRPGGIYQGRRLARAPASSAEGPATTTGDASHRHHSSLRRHESRTATHRWPRSTHLAEQPERCPGLRTRPWSSVGGVGGAPSQPWRRLVPLAGARQEPDRDRRQRLAGRGERHTRHRRR